jgi:large subunit ribosomal protein L23
MEIILKPVITEKMTQKSEGLNQFGFIVRKEANKLQIKEAIEDLYGVEVLSVNTLIHKGKRQQRFTKTGLVSGKKPDVKKAIVTLAAGDTIDFYSNI